MELGMGIDKKIIGSALVLFDSDLRCKTIRRVISILRIGELEMVVVCIGCCAVGEKDCLRR